MSKESYLSNKEVDDFIKWLAPRLESSELEHTWTDRRTGDVVNFKSLFDAFQKYKWQFSVTIEGTQAKGNTFENSQAVLSIISKGLRAALETEDQKGDAEKTLEWGLAVLRWGGVFPRNGSWLKKNYKQLPTLFKATSVILGENSDENSSFCGIERFNAGMTKIYSLLVPNFFIFDSRVAAAIGWLVTKYCFANGIESVPEALRFPWMPAKEAPKAANPKNRNPGVDFPRMKAVPAMYAAANLKASWLMQAALDSPQKSGFNSQTSPLRALEAALFMLGYDLGGDTPPASASSGTVVTPSDAPPEGNRDIEDGWDGEFFRLITRGGNNAKRFRYKITQEAVVFQNENDREDVFPVTELHSILHTIHKDFSMGWFPLANSVSKMGKGTERNGLGMIILGQRVKKNTTHAQAASYLGPFLEELGLVDWKRENNRNQWRLHSEPPSLYELSEMLAQIRDL